MRRKIDVRLPNNNTIVIGTSGSGKSSWVKQQIKTARRLLVWDPDAEYPIRGYRKKTDFINAVRQANGAGLRAGLSIEPTADNFGWFCQVAFAIASADRPLIVVAEEIADVTSTAKADPAWGSLCRRGRKYGVQLYAVTQRPAEADKTIYSQAAYKWVGYLDNETDQARIAKLLGLPVAQIVSLSPLAYLHKSPGPDGVRRGRVNPSSLKKRR